MRDVPEAALNGLRALISFLVDEATKSHGGSHLVFDRATGKPTSHTLALALALSCRGPDDVSRLLGAAAEAKVEDKLLPALLDGAVKEQTEFALTALRTAATVALDGPPAENDGGGGGDKAEPPASAFNEVAKAFISAEYGTSNRAALRRVAESSGFAS